MNDYMTDEAGAEAPASDKPEIKSETKTALLPIGFFQGKELEPGSVCSVKIEKVEDDQVQVSYMAHDAEEKSEEAMPMESPAEEAGADAGGDMMG